MLSSIFVGAKAPFNEILVHWLAQRTHLVGVIWVPLSPWKRSWSDRVAFLTRRIRKYGLPKVIDELLFYAVVRLLAARKDTQEQRRTIFDKYWSENSHRNTQTNSIFAEDLNSDAVMSFVEGRQPDIGFASCVHQIFSRELIDLPKLGMFLWHEGITPEYRGLYCPFWTVHNLDLDRIGFTLLRMNEKLDAGEIYAQGTTGDLDPFRSSLGGYFGHKAIFDGLPLVERFLQEVEAGTARPTDRSGAPSRYYTYPGLSDYIRQRIRLRRLRATIGADAESRP